MATVILVRNSLNVVTTLCTLCQQFSTFCHLMGVILVFSQKQYTLIMHENFN